MKPLTKLMGVLDRTIGGGAYIAGVLLVLIMFTVTYDVLTRYTGHPQTWVVEIIEYTQLYIVFLGAAWLLKEEGHIKVDILTNTLSPKAQALLGVFSSVLGIIVSLVLLIFGAAITWKFFITGRFGLTILSLPSAPFYAAIPIGSFFLSIQFVRRAYDYIVKYRKQPREKEQLRIY